MIGIQAVGEVNARFLRRNLFKQCIRIRFGCRRTFAFRCLTWRNRSFDDRVLFRQSGAADDPDHTEGQDCGADE